MAKTHIVLNGQFVPRQWFVDFKRAYEDAQRRGDEVFTFRGQEVLMNFAKHVIRYAETEFGTTL
jgi:hypothetical protein